RFISDDKPADQQRLQHARNHRPPEGSDTEPWPAKQHCNHKNENPKRYSEGQPRSQVSHWPRKSRALHPCPLVSHGLLKLCVYNTMFDHMLGENHLIALLGREITQHKIIRV